MLLVDFSLLCKNKLDIFANLIVPLNVKDRETVKIKLANAMKFGMRNGNVN